MAKAKINWIPKDKCGRGSPKSGAKYSQIIKMEEFDSNWSVVLICNQLIDNEMTCEMGFLSEEAPVHMLSIGKPFELYEGNKMVAKGQIL